MREIVYGWVVVVLHPIRVGRMVRTLAEGGADRAAVPSRKRLQDAEARLRHCGDAIGAAIGPTALVDAVSRGQAESRWRELSWTGRRNRGMVKRG
ncbi:hypothetical protein Acsp05_15670 [Actinokineospora sp. NBRC 105648]|nr:hypothetical protein Acsp05_15670 [Actinokineospora sp. NBRC 105648]